MAWYTVPTAKALRDAANILCPNRDTGADGFKGDSTHVGQGLGTQHNPRAVRNGVAIEQLDFDNGVVLAVDLDNDYFPGDPEKSAAMAFAIAEAARKAPHVLFVNWNWKVANGAGGAWRNGGADGPDHNHISFRNDSLNTTYDWVAAIRAELSGDLSSAALGGTQLSEEDDMYTDDDRRRDDGIAWLLNQIKPQTDRLPGIDGKTDIANWALVSEGSGLRSMVAGLAAQLTTGGADVNEAAIAKAVIQGLPDGLARTVLDGLRDRLAA